MKITIYNEYRHEQESEEIRNIYPDGIHACLADFMEQEDDLEVAHIATFDMEEHGLSEAVLSDTDVLVFWSHMLQEEFSDEVAKRVQKHVQNGMGLVALHSAHYSKVLRLLLGTTMTLRWRHGEQERIVVTAPSHPIAQGIPERFDLDKEEMYGEYFDIPRPDDVVFMGWFSGGDVFRSGVTFTRGLGRIFYFQPGHEEYPIYENPIIQRIIRNAVYWCGNQSIQQNATSRPRDKAALDNIPVRYDQAKLSAFFDHVVEAEEQTGKSMLEILLALKQAGLAGVEMRLSQLVPKEREVCGMLAQAGLQLSSLYEMYDWGMNPDYTEAIAQVDMAKKHGVKVILVVPGFLPEEEAKALCALTARKDIRNFMEQNVHVQNIKRELMKLVQYASTQGIIVTLEDFDGATAPFARTEELLYFMENVPGLKFTLDVGNFAYRDEDVMHAYSVLQEYVVHVHCKDRGEEARQEKNRYNKGLATVAVGEGYLPMDKIVKLLSTKGYAGYFAIEHFGAEKQYDTLIQSSRFFANMA